MTVRVISLDVDGCIFNIDYIKSTEKNVIQSNRHFLKALRKDNPLYKETLIFVGSNRQSKIIDDLNSKHNKGSCFPAIDEIKDYIQATFDTFLLADIYGNLVEGTSFARIMNKNYQGSHADWIFDESKSSILYAQMHKSAQEQPHEPIVFDFYDDRDDILSSLTTFYKAYPKLIPNNVTLKLNHYAGAEYKLMSQIQGTGITDINYRNTVKNMAQTLSKQLGASSQKATAPNVLPIDTPMSSPVSENGAKSSNNLTRLTDVCTQAQYLTVPSQEQPAAGANKPKKRTRAAHAQQILEDTKEHQQRQLSVNTLMKIGLTTTSSRFFSASTSPALTRENETQCAYNKTPS